MVDTTQWLRDLSAANDRIATLERQLAEAKGELSEIDSTLDSVTKCVAKTRADRIRDSFKHSALVTDAVIFDCEKQEQSARAQVIYWMGMAKAAADQLAEAKARLDVACEDCPYFSAATVLEAREALAARGEG